MQFVRSPLGAVMVVLLLGLLVALGATGFAVHRLIAPRRADMQPIDFESMIVPVEDLEFPASDGVKLAGWLIRGEPDLPPIVLCHTAGSSRQAMVNTALSLSRAGFTVLSFDFRAHGSSGGSRSTLGLHEKRDVLGAVDYLIGSGLAPQRKIGLFGIGMGAHAAVLAAADRPSIKVLVLDGLYPDVAYPLSLAVYGNWKFAMNYLDLLPRGWFLMMSGTTTNDERAADVIPTLLGRDMLLLAPAADTRLADRMMEMYQTVPDQADADGNLVVVPVGHNEGLYADQMARYHDRVTSFFLSRLGG